MDPVTIKVISTVILGPIVNSISAGAKKAGIKGIEKWEQTKFHTKVQKKISSIESLKTFWSADKLVMLHDFYYPSKIVTEKGSRHYQLLPDLPEGNLIIEGIVGQGKSIYLRHLATSEIRSNQSNNFPIFIEFRTLTKEITLENSIKSYLDDININGYDESTFEYVMSSGKFVLLLDAFDEIDDDVTKDTYLQIDRYTEKYDNLKIIITSRPSAEIQKSSRFKKLRLAPLTESDYTPFLSKLGLSSVFIGELKSAIKNSPSKISELITTPLMLTLVVLAYWSVKEIPENLPDFFEVLFKCVFSGHDNAKPYINRTLATNLSEKKLQELFEVFCFVCIKNKTTRSLSTANFDKYFDLAKTLLNGSACEAEDFRHDMNKVACLILPDGFDTWVFLHKSVLEYYAASFVKKSSENFAMKFYEYAMRDPQPWMEVLTFLNYIDEYRFKKYYLLEELKTVLLELDKLDDGFSPSSLVAYFNFIGFNFSMTLEITDHIEATIGSFGSKKPRFSTWNTSHKPFLSFFRVITNSAGVAFDSEYCEFLKKSLPADNRVTLDLQQSLKLFGDTEFRNDFKVFVDQLRNKQVSALEHIKLHESRCSFLDS